MLSAVTSPLEPGPIDDGAKRIGRGEHLTVEDAAVLEREMKDVPARRVGHRIEADHLARSFELLQHIPYTTETARAEMQPADTAEGLFLRHSRPPTTIACK